MDKKALLGKVFISYSCKDKDFVRKLADEIEDQGYSVWLDEKELIAGDSLPKTIGKAIETCRVSIIVLSRYSISSKWVQYEVSHATSRMIEGKMRLIPVLIEDVALPVELSGLVFVDFRESFNEGLQKIINALDYEASQYDLRRITKEPTFWELIEDILKRTFGSTGFGSIMGEYKSVDYHTVSLGEIDIGYEIVSSYGYERALSQQWWDEFSDVIAQLGLPYFLVVTERPVIFNAVKSLEHKISRILLQDVPSSFVDIECTKVVIVDLSKLDNPEDYRLVLEESKELIKSFLSVNKD